MMIVPRFTEFVFYKVAWSQTNLSCRTAAPQHTVRYFCFHVQNPCRLHNCLPHCSQAHGKTKLLLGHGPQTERLDKGVTAGKSGGSEVALSNDSPFSQDALMNLFSARSPFYRLKNGGTALWGNDSGRLESSPSVPYHREKSNMRLPGKIP